MTILELIKKSAIMLNIKEVLDDKNLDNISIGTQEDVLSNNFAFKRLFEFAKLVINEVDSYSPKIERVLKNSSDKKIMLSEISNLFKIIDVKLDGLSVKYKIFNNALNFDNDAEFEIVYQAMSNSEDVSAMIQNNNGVAEDIYVNGLNAYYCLACGLFAEYNVYIAQYADKLSKINNLKVFSMPCRSWHG